MKRILYSIIMVVAMAVIILSIVASNQAMDSNNANINTIDKNNNNSTDDDWVAGWTASLQAPFKDGVSSEGFEDQTLRFIVKPHIDGDKIRVRLSNVFGSTPLEIDEVHVAISKEGAENEYGTEKQLTFEGEESVTIPEGERFFSDLIDFELDKDDELTVSVYVEEPTGPTSWHPRSIQTSYLASGNHSNTAESSEFEDGEEAWFWLDGIDVKSKESIDGSVAVVGSSIDNGNYSTIDANQRWTDYLAKRFYDESPSVRLSVINAAITANQLLNSPPEKGEHMLGRVDRDVFSQTGIQAMILHGGLNDIRHHPEYSTEKIISRMKEISREAHQEGIQIYVATLTPFKGSGMYSEEKERTRQEVNDWIRSSSEFDGVIDFDKALRDPNEPKQIKSELDSGDGLHPNNEGYEIMADEVDLEMFE